MKKGILILLLIGLACSLQAQIFQSNFQDWDAEDNFPTDFNGPHTNISLGNVTKVTEGSVYGDFACKLENTGSSGKRFATQYVSVTEGESYEVTFWVRGEGDINARLYTDDYIGSTSYIEVNSAEWTEKTKTVTANISTDSAEVLIYVKGTIGDHIEIDSVAVVSTTLASTSIYDIQYSTIIGGASPLTGQTVETGGVVTAVTPDTSGYFIQNGSGPWSGIYVFDQQNIPEIGDSILFSAQVNEFYDFTELENPVNYTIVSSGNNVWIDEIDASMANSEEYEGCLIKLNNVECTGLPNNYDEWMANDNSEDIMISPLLYFYNPIVSNTYDITGVIEYSFGEFKLCPRSSSDVVGSGSVIMEENSKSNLLFYKKQPTGKLFVKGDGKLIVYNLSGQLVQSIILNKDEKQLNHLPIGIYTCILYDDQDGIQTKEKILIE